MVILAIPIYSAIKEACPLYMGVRMGISITVRRFTTAQSVR